MSRRIYEPSIWGDAAKNRHGINSLQRKPAAMRWWTPDCTIGDGGCDGNEPFLDNGFAQPGGNLQVFAFRLNDDGLIQTRGVLDASGGSNGGIAWTMPGANAGETDFIPPTSGNDVFTLKVTTDGTEAGIVTATGYIDKTTGEVTVRWVAATSPAWMAVFDNFYYGQDISSADGAVNLEYPFVDWSENATGIFDWVRSDPLPTSSITNTYNIQLLVDGIYTFTTWLVSEDLGVDNYEIRYYIDTGCFYPGRNPSQSDIVDREIITSDFENSAGAARSYSSPYVYYQRSLTLPCQIPFNNPPTTVYPYVVLLRPATAPDYSMTLRNRLWVTYHGPLLHSTPTSLQSGFHENYDPFACSPEVHPGDPHVTNCPP